MSENKEQLIDHLFRKEYGKLVATLTRLFGTSHIQLAEDTVQEALIAALNNWGTEGIPENPTAWLIQVAKRKAFNELKRNQMIQVHHQKHTFGNSGPVEIGNIFLKEEIEDSQLRMIFTCCHPSLNEASQIALTLKTLGGFGVKEVANALLTSKSTINKRLFRAKTSIRNSNIPFVIPTGKELNNRLETVITTLYLLFNEGYNSSSGNSIIQKELCLEAIRLTKLLVDRFVHNHQLNAFLSLMCFHVSRFEARIDDRGGIILFEEQNRSLWNKDLINKGIQYLQRSMHSDNLSAYHIEANIAAQHCLAKSFGTTNWQNLYDNYQLLAKLKPNPIIQLNLAIIQSKLKGLDCSLMELEKLEQYKVLENYHLLPATQGIFYMKKANYHKAIKYLNKALKLNPSLAENDLIKNHIQTCQDLVSSI